MMNHEEMTITLRYKKYTSLYYFSRRGWKLTVSVRERQGDEDTLKTAIDP